tara:strand:+ start:600 stop:788 length:189 start_codon:yes stop_codon:yes gene_type:complete
LSSRADIIVIWGVVAGEGVGKEVLLFGFGFGFVVKQFKLAPLMLLLGLTGEFVQLLLPLALK